MVSLITTEAAFSSLNWGLSAYPSSVKNFFEASRSFTGRFTKIICWYMARSLPFGFGPFAGVDRGLP